MRMKRLKNKYIKTGIFRGVSLFIAVLLVMMLPLAILAATERQSPDALLVQTNLTGTVTDIQDDPDSPDANWLTAIDNRADTVCRVSFPTPTGNPTVGAGLQEFKIWVRLVPAGRDIPTVRIDLYDAGVFKATVLAATSVTSATGQLFSATWDASLLADATGAGVECYIYGTLTDKETVEVGAVEWNVDYTPVPDISNTPSTWDVNSPNPVAENTTYATGLSYFTLTNNSTYPINVSISGEDMTGVGETWTLSNDGSNSVAGTYGLMAGLSLTSYNIVVRRDPTYNNLVTDMPASSTQDWGLQLLAPTTFGDGTTKTGTVTLTATQA